MLTVIWLFTPGCWLIISCVWFVYGRCMKLLTKPCVCLGIDFVNNQVIADIILAVLISCASIFFWFSWFIEGLYTSLVTSFTFLVIQQQTMHATIPTKKTIVSGSQLNRNVNTQVIMTAFLNHASLASRPSLEIHEAPIMLHTIKKQKVANIIKEFRQLMALKKVPSSGSTLFKISTSKCNALTAIINPADYCTKYKTLGLKVEWASTHGPTE